MASYGRNFGFRRSGGDAATREGRFRVPATGDFHQGDLVTIDPANPGFLKKAAAGAQPEPGVTGFLIQEFELDSVYAPGKDQLANVDSNFRGKVKNGYLATIWAGPGVKIWLRNTPAKTRPDGHTVSARTVVNLASVAVGDTLEWTGTAWAKTDEGAEALRVVELSGTTYAEAVLLV